MKMPTTTNAKVEAKASAPATEILDVGKQCLCCLEKKVRNLEKRKGRIEVTREKALKGIKLEKDQEVSVKQYEQVNHELQFAKELHKQFLTVNLEHEKMAKKRAKRERAERQATEIKRVGEILRLQSTLDLLGGDDVREDFKTGKHGAVVLTDDNLDQLDKLYQAISPSRDDSGDDYPKMLNAAAEHLANIVEGKDRQVLGTTYRELKELINLINNCGYFERAKEAKTTDTAVVETRDQEKESVETTVEESSPESGGVIPSEEEKEVSETQKPVDLSIGTMEKNAQSKRETPTQPMNTLEQDAFFAPSSTPYQTEPEPQFSQPALNTAPSGVSDFQSFTNNRPFQFIQTSYVMPDSASPTLVDPAVIVAQPAGASGLQFMSPGYDTSSTPTPPASLPPQQPQPLPQQPVPAAVVVPSQQPQAPNVNTLGLSQGSVQQPQHQPQDFSSQNFSQGTMPQTDTLFPTPAVGHEEAPGSISSHSTGLMNQMREESVSSSYEIPPSIPLPPSQSQDQVQLEQEQTQLHPQEKKFPMNANAPVFQSMYAQVATSGPVNVAQSSAAPEMQDFSNTPTSNGDFVGHDFQQGFQAASSFSGSGVFQRSGGNRGGYRGQRGGPNGSSRGGNTMQNGFSGRGGTNNNSSRGGGRGGTYQGYPQNANYRPEGFQGGYGSSGFGGTGGFQKRGGMNNAGGPGAAASSYPRGGGSGANGRGGGNMRGGMPRGGGPRGAPRGGFNRPLIQP